MFRDKRIVPALMFHSVGLENHPWAWSYISESLEEFEQKIAHLTNAGYHGVFWSDLYEHMAGRKVLPDNSILLTFDDGYLDNWVYVYPVLKKYGMKGTIFVSPDFVDSSTELRPNLEDVESGGCSSTDLQVPGFLSWAEMREMERSGVMDIQSHAMTHTWYYTGPRIVDFHRPHEVTPNPWLFWNARPDRKPYYLNEDQQTFVPWGYPILENGKSLSATRFFPEETALRKITDFVQSEGGAEFFKVSDWQSKIDRRIKDMFAGGEIPGIFESGEVRMSRIEHELRQSKLLIERNLDKAVDFICWPGGANDEAVQRMASEAGYKSWTLDSRSQLNKRNRPGVDPGNIKRIGTSSRIDVKGRNCGSGGARYHVWRVLEHQGAFTPWLLVRVWKSAAFAKHVVGGRQ